MKGYIRHDRWLIIFGLLIVILPFLGVPVLVKNIILALLGSAILVVAFSLYHTKSQEVVPYVEALPQVYEPVKMPEIVLSPLRHTQGKQSKVVRRRRTKVTVVDSIGDHAEAVQ